jgi:hypothetical protein
MYITHGVLCLYLYNNPVRSTHIQHNSSILFTLVKPNQTIHSDSYSPVTIMILDYNDLTLSSKDYHKQLLKTTNIKTKRHTNSDLRL